MVHHLRPRRIWDYIDFRADLSPEEHAHLINCAPCLKVFKLCLAADDPVEDILRQVLGPNSRSDTDRDEWVA
jgi:hypothetical protein